MQDALERGLTGDDYFHAEAENLRAKLRAEVHRDALAEANAIRYNVIQAFIESAAHPHDVHPLKPISITDEEEKET